jgi:hypothetical protein
MLLQLRASGVIKRPGEAVDHKRWARRIVQQAEQNNGGCGWPTAYALKAARAALGGH